MFIFQSSPCSKSLAYTKKNVSPSNYSVRSSFSSIESEKSIEKPLISTVDITSFPEQHRLPRESIHKRACRRFRRFCCHSKSTKTVPATTNEVAFSYAIIPLSLSHQDSTTTNHNNAIKTALIITYVNPSSHIQHTLESALQLFFKDNIFVVGNGNSNCPINNTSRICSWFGVRHIWIPTRSKVAAQYVGVAAASHFRYCMLIDEDVVLPMDFLVDVDRIESSEPWNSVPVKGIGYALEDTDDDDLDVQSLQHSLSELPETFFDKSSAAGCASFPYGAVSLWDRQLLIECFHQHPGYRRSSNWFLGFNLAIVLQR